MTKPHEYDDTDDDTDDGNDHKHDSYTAAGAATGASVPYFLFLAIWTRPSGPGSLVLVGASELNCRGLLNDSEFWIPLRTPRGTCFAEKV